MNAVKEITVNFELLPPGRNPYYQPPQPSKTILSPATRKTAQSIIIDADTVILDSRASDWMTVAPLGDLPSLSISDKEPEIVTNSPALFYRHQALKAYTNQILPFIPSLATGLRINLIA
jgi:hypothetical protein